MSKKYLVLICLVMSVGFMLIATFVYPGGSLLDENSIGFDWAANFFSNLFEAKAVNGSKNTARIWALIGIVFHSLGYGIFFINMSKKMPERHPATVLTLIGAANILFTFLIATPLHDIMVTLSSTLFLIGLFYITVFILKTKLHLLKFACIICLLVFYYTLFLYGSGNWGGLAIMQKVAFISSMFLIVGLEYASKREDFPPPKTAKPATQATKR